MTIIDEYSRGCLPIDVARELSSEDVLDRLTQLFITRGSPDHICSDNDPEFVAHKVRGWGQHQAELLRNEFDYLVAFLPQVKLPYLDSIANG